MAKVSLDRIFLYDVTICESKMPEKKFEKMRPYSVDVRAMGMACRMVDISPIPPSMSAALRPSWACPGVIFRTTGRPLASTSAWIFVVRPPLERPTHRASAEHRAVASAPLFLRSPRAGGREWTSCRSSGDRHHRPL